MDHAIVEAFTSEAHGVIAFGAQVAPSAAGFSGSVLVGLRVPLAKVEAVVNALSAAEESFHIATTSGRFPILVEVGFRDNEDLERTLFQRIGSINGVIGYETFQTLTVVKPRRNGKVL